MNGRSGLAGLALAAVIAACAPVKEIQPGEQPALDTDEAGLWMVMDRAEGKIRTSGKVVADPALNAYLRDMVCQLSGDYCGDVRVYIMRNPSFNASMAPNGAMYVNTGLILRADNEAQLAYVLAHELGHYLQRHSLARWRTIRASTTGMVFFQMALAPAGFVIGIPGVSTAASNLVGLGVMAGLMAYSRDQEREADDTGLVKIIEAGYDPREAAKIWQSLIAEREASEDDEAFEFFATHPSTEERLESLSRKAGQAAKAPGYTGERELDAVVRPHRADWFRDELGRRNYGATEVLLERKLAEGGATGEIHFFRGELYRLRGEEGDKSAAVEAYRAALAAEGAPPETYRSLGLALWALRQREAARRAFERYLVEQPEADDRPMIESYLQQTL